MKVRGSIPERETTRVRPGHVASGTVNPLADQTPQECATQRCLGALRDLHMPDIIMKSGASGWSDLSGNGVNQVFVPNRGCEIPSSLRGLGGYFGGSVALGLEICCLSSTEKSK